MIENLGGLARRFFKSNKWITFSCIIAVTLSTALIICIMNFSINSKEKLITETLSKFGDFDILCGYEGNDKKINKDTLKSISELTTIDSISPAIVTYTKANDIDAYTVGVENDDLSKSRYKFKTDIQEGAVVINEQLAHSLNLNVGDNIFINNETKKIVEIFDDETYSANSLNMVILRRDELKDLAGYLDEADFVMIKVDNKDYISDTALDLSKLDKDLRIDELQEDEGLNESVNTMMYFIIFLGALVFIMCGLFIVSNFQSYIYKYTKDFAIIKAIGGSSKQVFITVLLQTLMINSIGILSGAALSFVVCKLFLKSFKYYLIPTLEICLFGFVLIQIILLIPSFRTLKILPKKAMEVNNNREFNHKNLIKYIMIFMLVIGILLIAQSIILNDMNSFIYGIAGFLILYFAVFLLILLYINKILKVISSVLKIIIGNIGQLSMKMLETQVKKNSILVFSVTTMITITIIGSSFVKMIEKNNINYYKGEYLTDIVLTSDSDFSLDDILQINNDINNIDDTSSAFITSEDWSEVRGEKSRSEAVCILGTLDKLMEQGLIKKFDDFQNKVVISRDFANKNNISVGEKIKLYNIEREKKSDVIYENNTDIKKYEYEVEVGSIEDSKIMNNIDLLVDISKVDMVNAYSVEFQKMYIDSHNKNIDTFLKNEKMKYGNIKWSDFNTVLEETNRGIEERWKYFEIALVIINSIILLGIIISIKGEINSNRKQYALLRCMKISAKELENMILIQTTIFVMTGQILGTLTGTIGSCIVSLSDGYRNVTVPNYSYVLIICIISIFLIILCILPDTHMIKKQKLVDELGKEEL